MSRNLRHATLIPAFVALGSCSAYKCDEYASNYSCSYVENSAEYEVWYWQNLQDDNQDDNTFIGKAKGLKMCLENARAFASAIGETFDYRAYICILMDEGERMEKHRL